jgi:hypothetical protein
MSGNRKIIAGLVLVSLLSPREAHAKDDLLETILMVLAVGAWAGLLVGTYKTYTILDEHKVELSEDRADHSMALEYGFARATADSIGLGYYLSESQLIHARYNRSTNPDPDYVFKGYEIGYRHYLKLLYGELNLFSFSHQSRDESVPAPGGGRVPYYYSAYETTGVSATLGLNLQYGPISFGARTTYHRGIHIRPTTFPDNVVGMSEKALEEDQKTYRKQIDNYLQVGFSF